MRFEVKEKKKKRSKQMSPKQAIILMPILGIGMTLAFGWGIVTNVEFLTDGEVLQAEVTDTRTVRSGRRNRSRSTRVEVDYYYFNTAYSSYYKQRTSRPTPSVGSTVPIVIRPDHPRHVEFGMDGWQGRLRSEIVWIGIFLLIFDAAFVAVFRDAWRKWRKA